jgi:hypothetical protein
MKLFEIKKEQPNWLITESFKNTHLEHLEDLIFNNGFAGANTALDHIESIRNMLADGTGTTNKLTVKWDGSPAIICGHDPEDGKFFVGTKSVFNKVTPKICKSIDDITLYYGEKIDLAEKLTKAFMYLPKIGVGGVVQGDLMFTDDSVVRVSVNEQECYVFTPNSITYAVPVDSFLGKVIEKAKIGIIFHTSYDGESLSTMNASFGVNIAGLSKSKDVWFDDATYKDYTGIASLTPSENNNISRIVASTLATMDKIGSQKFDTIIRDKEFSKTIKPFVNKMIRQGTQISDPTTFLKDFTVHYSNELMKDIDTLVGGIASKAAQKRLEKIKQREDWIADNSNTLLGVLAVYKRIIELKQLILQKLHRVDSIGTFQKTDNGYKVTTPEGFVAIGHDGGAVKLVDRLEFSRTNFLKKA